MATLNWMAIAVLTVAVPADAQDVFNSDSSVTESRDCYQQAEEKVYRGQSQAQAEYGKAIIDCRAGNNDVRSCQRAAEEKQAAEVRILRKNLIDDETRCRAISRRIPGFAGTQTTPDAAMNDSPRTDKPRAPVTPNGGIANTDNGGRASPSTLPEKPSTIANKDKGGPIDAPPETQQDCTPPPPSGIREQLMQSAAQADRIATRWQEASILATGSFFQGMSESVAANLKFLAQAPGAPTQEIGQAVTDYLVKDNAKNHRELYAAAKRAVADLRKDPARFLGYQAGNVVFNIVTDGATKLVGSLACKVTKPGTLANRAQMIADAEKASDRLAQVDKMAQAPGNLPSCPIKEDCFWRAMRDATGDPAFDALFDGSRPASWQQVYDILAKNFGGKVDDVPFPLAHAQGIPDAMSMSKIMDTLQKVPGAEGIVFVGLRNGESHTFRAANVKGNVMLVDDQKQFWSAAAGRQSVQQAIGKEITWSTFYRTR